jgi:hypothetical protein
MGEEISDYLTLTQASRLLPNRPHPSTIWRWCRKGVLSRTGERVWLRHVRFGGYVYTRALWVEEFGCHLAQKDAAHFSGSTCAPTQSTAVRLRVRLTPERRIERAQKELKRLGFKS